MARVVKSVELLSNQASKYELLKLTPIMGEEIGGIVVHIGARIAALAAPGEVLVSTTVKDLVAGSGLSFRDHGTKSLKGVAGDWRLYSVER